MLTYREENVDDLSSTNHTNQVFYLSFPVPVPGVYNGDPSRRRIKVLMFFLIMRINLTFKNLPNKIHLKRMPGSPFLWQSFFYYSWARAGHPGVFILFPVLA